MYICQSLKFEFVKQNIWYSIRRFLLSVMLVVLAIQTFSQSSYPFIVDSMNVIRIPNQKSERLNTFYDKMNALLRGSKNQVSILHIGGSHVQADMFSHQVRSHFDTLILSTIRMI